MPTDHGLHKLRQGRLAAGLCRDCGLGPLKTKARCACCAEKHNATYRRSTGPSKYKPTGREPYMEEPGYKLQDDPKVQAQMSDLRDKWL